MLKGGLEKVLYTIQDTEEDVCRSIIDRIGELNFVGVEWRNNAFSQGLLAGQLENEIITMIKDSLTRQLHVSGFVSIKLTGRHSIGNS